MLGFAEWRTINQVIAVRKRVSAELLRRVMGAAGQDESVTVEGLMTVIFKAMDTDDSGAHSASINVLAGRFRRAFLTMGFRERRVAGR